MLFRKSVCTKPKTCEPRRSGACIGEHSKTRTGGKGRGGHTEHVHKAISRLKKRSGVDAFVCDRHICKGLESHRRVSRVETAERRARRTLAVLKYTMVKSRDWMIRVRAKVKECKEVKAGVEVEQRRQGG